jgi:hypothetical protein
MVAAQGFAGFRLATIDIKAVLEIAQFPVRLLEVS